MRTPSKVSLVASNLRKQSLIIVYLGHRLKAGCCPVASPPPSPTNDHRPPTPTVVAEVMCGERRREAFGTCARVAGSLLSVSVASPAALSRATIIPRCRKAGQDGVPSISHQVQTAKPYSVRSPLILCLLSSRGRHCV
jgi:hypothetical protein